MARKHVVQPVSPPPPPPPVAPEVRVAASPVFVEDAGLRLYQDRSGKMIRSGLTEGSDNFTTITQTARTVCPQE